MSLMSARDGFVDFASPEAKVMPDKELLEKALAAIKTRRGLIHGDLKDKNQRVCALGALVTKHGECTVGLIAQELQQYNDSMPQASPATRRAKVIAWIERRLKALQ